MEMMSSLILCVRLYKKNWLFPSYRPGEIFFSIIRKFKYSKKRNFLTSQFVYHFEFFVLIQISLVSKFNYLSEYIYIYIYFTTLIYKNHCSIEILMTTCEIFFNFWEINRGSKGLIRIHFYN